MRRRTTDIQANISESELAALADGSISSGRREALLERVSHSRELQADLVEQERAVRMIGALDTPAPAALRAEVQAMLATRPHKRRMLTMPRLGFAAAAATGLAATALAIGLSSGGSVNGVDQAVALTLRPATMGPPAESSIRRGELTAAVDGVHFPYWGARLGWRSAGARGDRVNGRAVTTVFYSNAQGLRVGYAIVAGPAWTTHGGTVTWRAGVPYRLLVQNDATVVEWPRGGHLCVIAGKGISADALIRLASWRGERSTAA